MTLPTTCKDFTSHPHIVEGRGCYACQEALASEEQGTTAIAQALNEIGIPSTVHQTGGFTMCAYVEIDSDEYIYATPYGAGLYIGEDHYEDIAQFDQEQSAETIANLIHNYINKGDK